MGGGAWSAVAAGVTVDSLVIRQAEDTDIPEIVRIERNSFADPWSADSFRGSLEHERVWFLVAEECHDRLAGQERADHVLLGYVVALVMADEAEIANLAVAPAGRRRGIGGLLLDRVVTDAVQAGVRTLYLDVRESNFAARALYDSRSFLQAGRRRGYYRHPVEDALLLKRYLVAT